MATQRKMTPKKRRSNTGDWTAVYILTLGKTANVRESCKAAGVSRAVAYKRRESDQEFAEAWQAAMDDALDDLEKAARKRAITVSDTLLIFLLKSHRRAIYGDRVALDHNNGSKLGADVRKRLDEINLEGGRESGASRSPVAADVANAASPPVDQSSSSSPVSDKARV